MACLGSNERWRKMAETHMYRWYMWWNMRGSPRNIFHYNMKKCVVVRERLTRGTGGKGVEFWSAAIVTIYDGDTENPGVENVW
jgi:hypothetical protein